MRVVPVELASCTTACVDRVVRHWVTHGRPKVESPEPTQVLLAHDQALPVDQSCQTPVLGGKAAVRG
eukprot:8420085-Alexandrium_andersonii.AAC.1